MESRYIKVFTKKPTDLRIRRFYYAKKLLPTLANRIDTTLLAHSTYSGLSVY